MNNPSAVPPAPHTNRLRRLKRQQWLLGLACTALVLIAWRGGVLGRLEDATIDWRTRWFNRWAGGPSPDIVVMGIDDRVIDRFPWPWSREVFAEAVKELRSAGARTIALDVVFDTPQQSAEGEAGPDEQLAAAIGAHSGVVLPMRTNPGAETVGSAEPGSVSALRLATDPNLRRVLERYSDEVAARVVVQSLGAAGPDARGVARDIARARTIMRVEAKSSVRVGAPWIEKMPGPAGDPVFPVAVIADAAAALGDVSINPALAMGPGGVYRRHPLLVRLGPDRVWASFSLAAVTQFAGCNISELEPAPGSRIEIPADPARRIPVLSTATAPAAHPFVQPLTWPRGGRTWLGQFSDADGAEAREVTIGMALEPLLIRRDAESNTRVLEDLLRLATALQVGDYETVIGDARALRAAPIGGARWTELLERTAARASEAAAEAADFLQFAGPADLASLSPEDARTYVLHAEVAEKIPAILDECRSARERMEIARVRLRDAVAGKLVFIGWTATGVVTDTVSTALGARTPGVYIHAAAASSFLTGFVRLPVHPLADGVLVVALGVAGIAGARRASVWVASLMLVATIGVWFVVAGVVLWDASWLVAGVAAPSAAAGASWLGVMLHRLLVEQRLRRRTEERFRAYVSPGVVDELVNNPRLDSMRPERRELSIMFCDVAGFTTIAERLGAEGTARFLSGYLGRMTDTLLRHGATIDKYLGDGIMAFWGAPIHDPRHARNACRAAVALARAVSEFGAEQRAGDGGGEPLRLRIGLAAGDVMVGDFGNPPIRSTYTVLGDACNVAARLERANKLLGTTILVSAGARAQAGDGFTWRYLGRFVLPGRLAPEPVSQLVGVTPTGVGALGDGSHVIITGPGARSVGPDNLAAWIRTTEEGVARYTEGRWGEARDRFNTLARDFGDERLARLYLDAIEQHTASNTGTAPDAIQLSIA